MALEGRTEVELAQSVIIVEPEDITNDVEMEVVVSTLNDEEPQTNQATDDNPEQPAETPQILRTAQIITAVQESPDVFQPKTSKQAKRLKQQKSPEKSAEKDDDSHCCPICFEPWSNSGSHRLASLNCGHLFGRSCIEKWIKAKGGNDKCPQCNAPAKRKDIRNIYARAIKTIDTAERDRALADLEKEKEARNRAEQAEARVLLQYQLAKAECDRVKLQLEQQRELLLSYQMRKATCGQCGCVVEDNTATVQTRGETSSQPPSTCSKCFVLQSSFQVAQTGARVMAFDRHHALLVISKPSPNQLFPGFGVVKVSSLQSKHCEFVRIHQKPVRDAVFNEQGDGLLLTAGMDKTLRMTSAMSNTVVQTYTTPVPAWSCAWNNSDTNYIYCGLQNGACLIFDVRNTHTYLASLQNEAAVSCPVVSLAHVQPNPQSLLMPGGLLACKLEGACFWENTFGADYLPHHLTLPEGSCTSLSFEPTTRHCMFSLRPSKSFQKSRHMVCQLQGHGIGTLTSRGQVANTSENNQNAENTSHGAGLCTSHVIAQCVGGSTQKLLSRSTLFLRPGNSDKLVAAAGDENSKATLVWDANNGKQLQKLPNQGGAILDVTTFNADGSDFLTTIDEQKLSIYKWQ